METEAKQEPANTIVPPAAGAGYSDPQQVRARSEGEGGRAREKVCVRGGTRARARARARLDDHEVARRIPLLRFPSVAPDTRGVAGRRERGAPSRPGPRAFARASCVHLAGGALTRHRPRRRPPRPRPPPRPQPSSSACRPCPPDNTSRPAWCRCCCRACRRSSRSGLTSPSSTSRRSFSRTTRRGGPRVEGGSRGGARRAAARGQEERARGCAPVRGQARQGASGADRPPAPGPRRAARAGRWHPPAPRAQKRSLPWSAVGAQSCTKTYLGVAVSRV